MRLFAAARLMKKLELGADDYVILCGLTALDASASPAETLNLVEAIQDLGKSPLKPADVRFMLEHQASNLADREIKDDRITPTLQKLQKDYQANFAASRSAFNANLSAEEQKETLCGSIPLGRFGTAEEMAEIALWLCFPAADFITGQTINANGGVYLG